MGLIYAPYTPPCGGAAQPSIVRTVPKSPTCPPQFKVFKVGAPLTTGRESATPRAARYLFFAGTIADQRLRDSSRGLSYFERAVAAEPSWIMPLALRADLLCRSGEHLAAERDLRAAIQRGQVANAPLRPCVSSGVLSAICSAIT